MSKRFQTFDSKYSDLYENCEIEIWFPNREAQIYFNDAIILNGYFDIYKINDNKWGTNKHLESISIHVNSIIKNNIEEMWKLYDASNKSGYWGNKKLYDMTCHISFITNKNQSYEFLGCIIQDYKNEIATFSPSSWYCKEDANISR